MRKFIQKAILLAAIIFVLEGIRQLVFASSVTLSYPAFTQAPSPADMVGQIYTYALSIAGALAIIRVVYGGIIYIISAGNTSKQSDARDIITSAIWGLVLLAGAYLLLNTINPEIVQLKNPNITPISATGGATGGAATGGTTGGVVGQGGTTGGAGATGGWGGVDEQSARTELAGGGVQVKPQCSPGQTVGCATLNDIQQSTINELIVLKKQCDSTEGSSCNVLVNEGTGGTHSTTGTLTHENGYKADLNYSQGNSLYNYITQNFTPVSSFTADQMAAGYPNCSSYSCYQAPSGAIYMAEGNPPTHWDVTVPPAK